MDFFGADRVEELTESNVKFVYLAPLIFSETKEFLNDADVKEIGSLINE